MKKLISYISCAVLLIVAACSSEEVKVENPEQGLNPNLRTEAEAVALAKNLYELRNPSRAEAKVANVAIIGSTASRSAADTLIYAVNFADNQGFTLVSAAKSGEAIIGYTEEGSYNEEEAAENPNFGFFLDAANQYVGDNVANPQFEIIPDPGAPVTTSIEKIRSRVLVNYGQGYPEGMLFASGIAGCAQTASAMVCSYYHKPTSIEYTCPDIDLQNETINWEDLKNHLQSLKSNNIFVQILNHNSSCDATEESHNVLSRLCREIGYRNTNSPDPTSINIFNMLTTLRHLLPECEITPWRDFSKGIFYNTLSEKGIICVAGSTVDSNPDNEVGHVWICDGGEKHTVTTKTQLSNGEWNIQMEYKYYNHYNWGNCGSENGYFFDGVFDTTMARSRADYKKSVIYISIK